MKGVFIMENKAKQMIDYNKAAFETYFNSILILQEQTTKALDDMLRQSSWIPAQTKSFINEWTGVYKKATVDFKESVDQNYLKIEKALISSVESFKPTDRKKAKR
jgi:hypothetical protein